MIIKKKNFFFLFFIILPIFIFSEFFLFLLFFFSELFLILSNFCFQIVDNFFFFSFWNNAQKNTNQCDNIYYNLFSIKNVPISFLNNIVTDLCFNFSNQPFFFFFALFFFFFILGIFFFQFSRFIWCVFCYNHINFIFLISFFTLYKNNFPW